MNICKNQIILFDHSQLKNLSLKNLAIYPGSFMTDSTTTLDWSNLDFEAIGVEGSRVWNLKGAGSSESNTTTITYTVAVSFGINFYTRASGVLTSGNQNQALNVQDHLQYRISQEGGVIVINMTIEAPSVLEQFFYDVYIKDGTTCLGYCNASSAQWPVGNSNDTIARTGQIFTLTPVCGKITTGDNAPYYTHGLIFTNGNDYFYLDYEKQENGKWVAIWNSISGSDISTCSEIPTTWVLNSTKNYFYPTAKGQSYLFSYTYCGDYTNGPNYQIAKDNVNVLNLDNCNVVFYL